mgnify:CR=1 FL=1
MALGEQLRNARLNRNETPSQVAAATQMMVQLVEDLEREDFSRVPAPIYAKGFIKLYARHVGLDPQPLINEYVARHASPTRPSLVQEQPPSERPAPPPASAVAPSVTSQPEPEWLEAEDESEPSAPPPGGETEGTQDEAPPTEESPSEGDQGWKQGWEAIGERSRDIHDTLRKHHTWLRNRPSGSLLKYVPVVLGILLIIIFLASSLSRLFTPRPGARDMPPPGDSKEEVRLIVDPPPPFLD